MSALGDQLRAHLTNCRTCSGHILAISEAEGYLRKRAQAASDPNERRAERARQQLPDAKAKVARAREYATEHLDTVHDERRMSTRTETERQFWRESEQQWVDHVHIRTWGAEKDTPTKWRHRIITTTVERGEWQKGKS